MTDNNAAVPENLPPAPTLASLVPEPVTPEHVARLAQQSVAMNAQSIEVLRQLGAAVARMGRQAEVECETLAEQFEQHAKTVHETVMAAARTIYDRGAQIEQIRRSSGLPSRNAEIEQYGVRGVGQTLHANGSADKMPAVVVAGPHAQG